MVYLILFLMLTLMCAVGLIAVCVSAVRLAVHGASPSSLLRLKRWAACSAAAVILNAGLIVLSQWTASTPAITDEQGNRPAGSIAELVRVDLGGRREWITIRGWDKEKPVLLFLAGGPGGTQLAAARHELAALEKDFVVIGWDQPGSGKSSGAVKINDLSVETYIADGHALTGYLKERFGKEKIFLIGESWGSALGVFLADRYPEDYYALIGTAQMVDFVQTDRMDYRAVMEMARDTGDSALVKRLTENGEPPYDGKGVALKTAVFLNYLSAKMARDPRIHNAGYDTPRDIGSPEYGLLDKINFFRGLIETFDQVYPQLYSIDLRRDFAKLEIPIWFFLGRHDLNAPASLAEDYERVLQAPSKGIVWFEHSGHSPWINERDKFSEEVLKCFTAGLDY